jgi:hypothetical protein
VTVDWERFKANRYSDERPPQGWGWPENIRPISTAGLSLFAVEPDTNKLYWNGKEIVLRDAVRLEWPERLFTFLIAVGTFGYFILEVGKVLKWWGG